MSEKRLALMGEPHPAAAREENPAGLLFGSRSRRETVGWARFSWRAVSFTEPSRAIQTNASRWASVMRTFGI